MSAPRGLSEVEAAAWDALAATVEPLAGKARPATGGNSGRPSSLANQPDAMNPTAPPASRAVTKAPPPSPLAPPPRKAPSPESATLDGSWDRRLKSGTLEPEVTLDLHGHGLDGAYHRLMDGVSQARAMGARTILLVTGKPRPVDPADRGTRRGAIRAKVLDWLAASEHADAIAVIRRAHIRHGGAGALYIVLRRGR